MMNWFGLSADDPPKEDSRQTASLMEHDVMEKKKKKKKKKQVASSGEGSSVASPAVATSGKKKKKKKAKDSAAKADNAEELAEQMKSAASWWLDEGNKKESAAAAASKNTEKMKANLNWWEAASPDVEMDEISGIDLGVEEEFKPIEDFDGADLTFDILANLRNREAPGYDPLDVGATSAEGGETRTKQMRDAMDWWSKAYKERDNVEADKEILQESAEEMQEILQWWADRGKLYKGPSADDRKCIATRDLLSKWGDQSLNDKKKAK